jgi:hypothetical protein
MIEVDIDAARAAVAKLGVQICVVFPATMLALALILKKSFYSSDAGLLAGDSVVWLGYVFVAVAIVDLIAALLIKRKQITPENLARRLTPRPNLFAKQLAAAYVPVLALCAAPALYGLIFYFIGGDQETYVLISVICPAAFLVVKPRSEEVEAIATELFRSETDSDLKL